ncbi:hypothetical protein PENSOL_c011G11389 [Penicillium solitum]|uniref:Uncharacterized protein n=1 Tax=Penicillium solitum TaxID=60172 RepID=A0A1V6R838_9EURO|nr:uncharacterized protein PENSOL_c011G11389 [Penicillium solitum]OQD97695.1 hypothetical protein PENSOL_c011G11389 [Penicillium solitum]
MKDNTAGKIQREKSTIGVREQLYVEENQRLDKKKKAAENSTTSSVCPPININVLPARSSQQSIKPPASDAMASGPGCTKSIIIDGLLDVAVDEYTEWQQSRIYEDQDPGFFVKHGVKVGAARRFVRDIGLWVKRRKEVACNEYTHLA